MKVLHVIPSVSLAHGGPSRAILEMERVLSDRGIQVTTVTTNDDGNGRRLNAPYGKPVSTQFATRWYFPLNTEFYKVSLGLGGWLKNNIAAYDLVHIHALFSFAPTTAALIARQQNIPYILRPLGVLGRYGMMMRRAYLKKASFALIEKSLIESASVVHFTSLSEMSEASTLGLRCNGIVIPLGIDTGPIDRLSARTPANSDKMVDLLFLSRIDRKKNLEGLLQAMSLVLATRRDVRLSVAGQGDPPYMGTLKELAQSLNIEENVKWLGFIDGEEKRLALQSATAFVLPSYSENFGIAVLEALVAGLPCIVSEGVAISGEISLAKAGVTTATDAASIAAGILKVINSPSDYSSMSLAAEKLAKASFSREAMGRDLENLYRNIKKGPVHRGPHSDVPA
jgi:glycosyltransferase involved in cell wall biosynthesis